MFCIQDDEYRGKGTTAGRPYFDCGRKNAVWVSIDMVIYPPDTPHGRTTSGNSQHDDNTAEKSSRASKIASKVMINFLKMPEMKNKCSKLFKEGDRVVVYSMKDQRPIFATVRWTGAVQLSEMLSVIFAGLESV